MPVPWHCRQSIDRYLDWIVETIEHAAGYLDTIEGDSLIWDPLIVDGDEVGVIIQQQRIRFYDDTCLDFHQLVSNACDVDEYGYHHMHADGAFICRLDKHPGHEQDVGGLTHLHVPDPDGERILPAPEFAFDDAIRFLREFGQGNLDLTNFPG